MRIAMIGARGVPATYGGVERAVEELGATLASRGHDVTVFCRPDYVDSSAKDYRGMRRVVLPTVNSKHLEAFVHSGLSSLRTLGRRFDVVHFHAMGPGLFSPLPAALAGAAIVQTIQGLDQDRGKWGGGARRALDIAAWLSAHVPDATVVVSQDLAEYYRRRWNRTTYCIPNGVTEPVPVNSSELLKERFGLDPGDYLLFVGRLVPEKAPDQLIRAFGRLNTSSHLVLAGGTSHSDRFVEELATLARKNPNVMLPGYVHGPELAQLFAHAKAFVLPSLLEGLPLALLEAASYGVPVVVSDIAPHREVLGASAPGRWLFESGDEDALAGALDRALHSQPEDQAGARSLREHVLGEYGWERITDSTERVYASAIDHMHRNCSDPD